MPGASSVSIWIVGVLFVAGGFAAGYVVGGGGGAALVTDDEGSWLDRRTGSGSDASPVVTLERPRAPDEPRLESTLAAELEPVRRVIEELPPPTIPTGSGVIHGRVRSADGEPLAGVAIHLLPRREGDASRTRKPGEEATDLATAVRSAIDRARWRHLSKRSTTTTADGTYRLEGLADLAGSLSADLPGWKIQADDPRKRRNLRPDAEIDFTAKPVVRVSVTILLPDGAVPEVANLYLRQGHSMMHAPWHAKGAYAELEPGTWEITAHVSAPQSLKSDPKTVSVEAGKTPEPLRFQLATKGGIQGHVKFAPGEALSGGRVAVVRIPKGRKADASLLASSDKSTSLHSWGRGAPVFQFADLPPGRYLVGLCRTYNGAPVVFEEAEVTDESVDVVIQVPPLEREDYVIVAVVGPDGKPAPSASIRTGYQSKAGGSSSGAVSIARSDGTQWVIHQEGADEGAGDVTYWVEAEHPEYGKQRAEYKRTRATTAQIRFGRPASLELTVTGVAGSRYEGRVHAVLSVARRSFRQEGTVLDAEGRITFKGVQPGTYPVALSIGASRGQSEILRQDVEITSGTNRLTLDLPPLYDVVVEGATGGFWIRSTRKEHRFHKSVMGVSEGRATVDGLPAGEYEARSGRKRLTFRLPGASTVSFE